MPAVDERIARMLELRACVADIPLSAFKCRDFVALAKVQGLGISLSDLPTPDEMDRVELVVLQHQLSD